jgi:hypothetical protein
MLLGLIRGKTLDEKFKRDISTSTRKNNGRRIRRFCSSS